MVDVWMLDVHVSELPIGFQTVNLAPCYPSELKPGHQPICAPSVGVSRGYRLGRLQFRLPRRGSYRHGNHSTLHTYTYHPIWCCLVSLHTHTPSQAIQKASPLLSSFIHKSPPGASERCFFLFCYTCSFTGHQSTMLDEVKCWLVLCCSVMW